MSLVARSALAALGALALVAPARADAPGERVDRIMERHARSDGPGCAVGVSRDGVLLLAKGYGLANLDHAVPNTAETVFDVSSVSKQFTAAAILLLADEGRLSLDDPVQRHVPELPDYGEPLTLRHLIHHTGGVRDYLELQELAGMPAHGVYDLGDLLALIARQRELNFSPGSQHLNSNSGYMLLAVVAERASGQSLGAFLKARIFEPLGMLHTVAYDDSTRVIPRRATGYAPRPGGGWAVDHYYNFAVPGDGQVYTTLADLARWDRAFTRGGVGGAGFMARLLEPGRLADGTLLDYAFGLRLGKYRGLATVRHGGSWGGFRAHFLRYPEPNLAVSCLCNDAEARPEELAEAVAEVFLEEEMQPEPEGAPPAFRPGPVALEALAGTFRQPRGGRAWELRLRRGALHARALDGGPERRLIPLAPGRFRVSGSAVQIRFEAGRDGRRLVHLLEGVGDALLEEVEVVPPTAAQLEALAGTYRSDELDVSWTVSPAGSGLEVEMSRNGAGFELSASISDFFLAPDRVLEFERDAAGSVTGVRVHSERVRNLRFVRLP